MLIWLVVMQEAEPVMAPDAVLSVLVWQHPPATLPKPPRGVGLPEALTMSHIASVRGLPLPASGCAMQRSGRAYLQLYSTMLLLIHLQNLIAIRWLTY